MAVPTLVTGQHALAHSAVSVASLSVSLPAPVTPGNSVHAHATAFNYTFSGTEITDNQGNGAYPLDAQAQTAGAGVDAVFSKQNVAASGTFTVTDTFSPNSHGDLYVAEFSGVALTGALDKHVTSTPTPAGSPATWTGPASGVLAQAGELVIVAANAVGNAVTTMSITTAGYTAIDAELDGTQYDVSIWGWKVAVDTSTQQAAYQEGESAASLGTCPSLIVTYKAAQDPAPLPMPLLMRLRAFIPGFGLPFRPAQAQTPSALTAVSNAITIAVEAAQGVAQTVDFPDESAQGISTSSAEPVEALQGITTTAAADPVEANQGITATAQDPVDATAGIATTASEPVESLQAIASTLVEPAESLGGVATTASDPVESLQGIAATGAESVEATKGLSTTATDPVESTGGVATTASDPVEALQGISSTASDPVEAQGNTPVAQTAVLPFESLVGGVTVAPVAPVESLSSVATTKQSPIEATGGVTAAPAGPVESLTGVTSSLTLSAESASPVSRALVAVFEALAGIANAVLAPFESIRITPLSGPADTARTRSGPAASRTTFSGASGRTSTEPGDGETTTNFEG